MPAKTIVTRTKGSAWFGCDYNMNIYRGCCHGCIYCDSRSASYGIEGFDEVCAKKDALRIIRDDLRRKVKTGVVATGSMSDPYNPFEKELCLTRNALELLNAFQFGVAIATKSFLVVRDVDILCDIAEHSPVLVKITVTTDDDALAAVLEPRAPAPSRRFAAVSALAARGIFTGILLMPVLPFIEDTDENIRAIVQRAAESGARFIYPAFGVTLRQNQRDWFYDALDKSFPGVREKYQRAYGDSYECRSPRLKTLLRLFAAECGRHGLLYQMPDIISAYKLGYKNSQLSFF